jgi:hypothetical protein
MHYTKEELHVGGWLEKRMMKFMCQERNESMKNHQSIGKSGETKIESDKYLSRAPLSDRKEKRRDGKSS